MRAEIDKIPYDSVRVDREMMMLRLMDYYHREIADDLNSRGYLTITGMAWQAGSIGKRISFIRLHNTGSWVWGVRFNVMRVVRDKQGRIIEGEYKR